MLILKRIKTLQRIHISKVFFEIFGCFYPKFVNAIGDKNELTGLWKECIEVKAPNLKSLLEPKQNESVHERNLYDYDESSRLDVEGWPCLSVQSQLVLNNLEWMSSTWNTTTSTRVTQYGNLLFCGIIIRHWYQRSFHWS